MRSSWIFCTCVMLCGCKYEFVEGPHEAADEESSSDSSEAGSGGTDAAEQDPAEAGDTGETGSAQLCGNGFVDPPEECDEEDFSGRDCMTLGFKGGVLACTLLCKLDTSMCAN